MLNDEKKVVIVGVGMVGMSFAYALLNQNICDELVLIDINKVRARGEAADLSHGLPFDKSAASPLAVCQFILVITVTAQMQIW